MQIDYIEHQKFIQALNRGFPQVLNWISILAFGIVLTLGMTGDMGAAFGIAIAIVVLRIVDLAAMSWFGYRDGVDYLHGDSAWEVD